MSSFQDTLRAIRHPDHWELHVESFDAIAGPVNVLDCPEREDDPAAFLKNNGVPDGKYRIALESTDRGQQESTKASAKGRLRKHGPMSTVVEVGVPGDSAPAVAARRRSQASLATRSAAERPLPIDPEIAASERAAAAAQAKAAELRSVMELRRVERESEAMLAGTAAAGAGTAIEVQLARLEAKLERIADDRRSSSGDGLARMLEVLAPFVVAFQQSSARRDGMFVGLLTPGEQQAQPSGVDTVQSTMELTKTFLDMVNTHGGGGGEGGGGMLGDVASILRSMQVPAAGGPALPAPSRAARGARRAPPRKLSPEEDVRMRVLMFVDQVQRFASQETDPFATADALEPAFGLLPKEFRDLVLGSNVDALVAALARWLPQSAHQKLTGMLTTHPTRRQWIEEFQSALRGEGEDDLDDGEDLVEAESTEPDRLADYVDPEAASSADRAAALFPEPDDPFGLGGPVGPATNGPTFPEPLPPATPQG